jgi:hypothetical protein
MKDAELLTPPWLQRALDARALRIHPAIADGGGSFDLPPPPSPGYF